jgi:hypothetical protein
MTRILKTAGFSVVALLVLLAACSKKKTTQPESAKYKWTVLGYFDGNNYRDQTRDGFSYVIKDVQELEETGSTDQVQVVVMVGSIKTDGNSKYYHIEKHESEAQDTISSPVLQDLGKKDMSDYTTLRDFIGYAVQNYPAERYMLIIGDHGNGWRGTCSDSLNGGGSWMSLPDLSSALLGYQFDIIWLYSPTMATAEVAHQVRERSDYLVASQFEIYPDNITGSSHWLGDLVANPDLSTRLFALDVVDGVQAAVDSISPNKVFHVALIQLSKMNQLADDLSALAQDLVDSTGSRWTEVWDAWEPAQGVKFTYAEYVDLREFARQMQTRPSLSSVIKNDAAAVEASVDDAVLAQLQYPTFQGTTGGLSISLPWSRDDFDSLDYAALDLGVTDWPALMSAFTKSFSENYAGILDVRSNVQGARIFVDGIDTGFDTNALVEVLPGNHEVHLEKAGYCHSGQDPQGATVSARQTVVVRINLVPCR